MKILNILSPNDIPKNLTKIKFRLFTKKRFNWMKKYVYGKE